MIVIVYGPSIIINENNKQNYLTDVVKLMVMVFLNN